MELPHGVQKGPVRHEPPQYSPRCMAAGCPSTTSPMSVLLGRHQAAPTLRPMRPPPPQQGISKAYLVALAARLVKTVRHRGGLRPITDFDGLPFPMRHRHYARRMADALSNASTASEAGAIALTY